MLLTSRNQVITADSGYVHKMKVLDDNQSWELFLRKTFVDNTNTKCPEELMNIAEEILKKCGGLPLAISVVGGILAKKTRSESEWEKILKEMKYHLDRSADINTISAILELSYHNIPPELKACFLCLGFFKEDAIIKAKDLVHIWVAQGLVRQQVVGEGETMEDVARDYLNELIGRNMVQVKESRYDHVKTCQMHDLLRDLSIRKAKEEIDFEVLTEEGNSHQSLDKPRHRAIYSSRPRFIYSTTRNQCIRSLFFHGETRYSDGGPSSYWKSFELLRVLDFGVAELRVLPKAIGALAGLRYLKMKYIGGGISKLPRSWANLKNLEVLDLRGYPTDVVIDIVVLKMESLRHLYLDISYSEVHLGNMRSLHTLSLFRVKDSDVWQLQEMGGASKLGIDMSEMSDASMLLENLSVLENLVCLTLKQCTKAVNMEGMGGLQRITRLKLHNFRNMKRLPDRFPPNLCYLTLSLLWLTGDPMPVLERLPKLLYLKLDQAYSGEEMVVSRRGFANLKILHLRSMNMVRIIQVGKGAMAELEQLLIRKCSNLKIESLPERLRSAVTDAD